ncbi:hypothetical protein PFUGPA_03412 [Plasmodium falciparum Palo Alto/Uganda]|uniref:Uncharacterized protein n=1 Tax=Plasmodium falciparum (isolate Palo Alto / Uganda) TaxID=57270 RepID=W4IXV6_PLAFP|nr:hypothetical protein PFUGPA_03412 [Plasmodium falciparum Palo Alto/Uganda]
MSFKFSLKKFIKFVKFCSLSINIYNIFIFLYFYIGVYYTFPFIYLFIYFLFYLFIFFFVTLKIWNPILIKLIIHIFYYKHRMI